MRVFSFILLGQLVSLIGSHVTGFSLGLWVYERTDSVTLFSLVEFAVLTPEIILAFLMGILVDRWNRRQALIIGHVGAGVCTLILALLYWTESLEVSHVLLLSVIGSAFNALILPAFSASVTMLVSARQLGRANGMILFGFALTQVSAPALGGVLLLSTELTGVFLLDIASFVFAIGVLLKVDIPQPAHVKMARDSQATILEELVSCWSYICQRPGLKWLLLFLILINFNAGLTSLLITPLVLNFANEAVLGVILSIGGIGMMLGSLVMIIWGGPKSQIDNILIFTFLQGMLLVLMAAKPTAYLVAIGAFHVMFTWSIIRNCNHVIWQRKVPPELQARILGFRITTAGIAIPIGYLVAGPLAEGVFEPLMMQGGVLASTVGRVLGVGQGRGIALLLVVCGLFTSLIAIVGYLNPRFRFIEKELPDELPDTTCSITRCEDHEPLNVPQPEEVVKKMRKTRITQ